MSSTTDRDVRADKQSAGRTTYRKPELREFGCVGVLTQGGSGIMVEGAMGMGGMMGGVNNPNRRP